MGSYGLHRVFTEPSSTSNTSSTCIDNIFRNFLQNSYTKITQSYHISDHVMLKIELFNKINTKPNKIVRNNHFIIQSHVNIN